MMNEEILDVISREVMEQYERLRQAGCNMLDLGCVSNYCEKLGFDDLLDVAEEYESYFALLSNFGELMGYYGISQEA